MLRVTKNETGLARLLTVVLIVVLMAGAAAAAYAWQQNKVEDQKQQKQQALTQLQNLQKSKPGSQSVSSQPSDSYRSKQGVTVKVYTPQKNSAVQSPLVVIGQVPGSWSFEAQFPVVLKDSAGNVLAKTTAKLAGDWMTEELVPFTAALKFDKPTVAGGTLELQKDNPSGDTAKADTVISPVRF